MSSMQNLKQIVYVVFLSLLLAVGLGAIALLLAHLFGRRIDLMVLAVACLGAWAVLLWPLFRRLRK